VSTAASTRPLPVTILCATLNAFDAVRLTFRSLLHHTPPVARILVADNGSSDGTLDWLRTVEALTVISLDERRQLAAAEHAWQRSVSAALDRRGAPTSVRASASVDGCDPVVSTEHAATLDWLAAQVATPYLLTLDSDVEVLEDGWLEEMLELMEGDDLAAQGSLEPGRERYRPRLALHLLLVRTAAFRAVAGTFRGTFRGRDAEEEARWRARRTGWYLDFADLDAFPGITVYPPGADLLERLERAGHRWAPMAPDVEARVVHYGHLSWGGDADRERAAPVRAGHDARMERVRERLLAYEPA
jgi:hypothetical protein